MIQAEDIKIKKITDKLLTYDGLNPYLNYLKKKVKSENYQLTKTQIDYVNKNHNREIIELNNIISITKFFGQELQKEHHLKNPPEKILIQSIIGENDKSYHVLGKLYKNQEDVKLFWLPKTQLIDDLFSTYDDVKINFEKYEEVDKLGRKYFNHQKEGVKFLLDKKKCILADDMGLGKVLANDTPVLTPYGWVDNGSLKIGDYVIGSNGKPTKILGVYPQPEKNFYSITLTDGTIIESCDEHLWAVQTTNHKKRNNGFVVKELKEIIDDLTYGTKGNIKWYLPMVNPVEFEKSNLNIDPYVMGCLLGDGGFSSHNIRFTSNDDEIINEIRGRLPIDHKLKQIDQINYHLCGVNNTNLVIRELNEHKLMGLKSEDKFIPNYYLYSDINDRINLLQGLLDADGYCSKQGTIQYYSVSKKLSDGVRELVQSLGGVARMTSKIGKYKLPDGTIKICKECFILTINLPSNIKPFKLKRKLNNLPKNKKYHPSRGIKKIEFSRKTTGQCIMVEAKDHLYVMDKYVVTHNTTQAILAALETKAERILVVCPSSLKINWQREIENFLPPESCSIIRSIGWNPSKFTIINYDILKNFHTVTEKGKEYNPRRISREIVKEKFDVIILDESHYVKNSKSNRGKIIQQIIKESNPKYIWLLTGTPIANRPIDYFSLLGLIKAPVASDWMYYVRRYCGGRQIKTKVNGKLRTINLSDGASNLEELSERTKTTILRRKKNDVLDLPEKVIVPIYIELENRDGYEEVFDKYLEWRKSQGKSGNVVRHLVELILLRKFIAIEKVKNSIELAESAIENGKKVLIFTNFTEELGRFRDHFGKIGVYLDGSTKEKDRQKAVDKFQNDDKIKVFVGQIKAAGVGLTLTKAEIVIINSLDWVPGNLEQAEDRAYRIGQIKDVTVYYPLFDDTVDTLVWKVLQNKKSIINTIVGDINDQNVIETIIEQL